MKKLRTCEAAQLYTGTSKCPPDFGKMKLAILVRPGVKLPAELTAEALEKMAHADRAERAYGIVGLCEYNKNGGEVQTAANGYGPEQVTGVSARKDTFDLNKFYPELDASLMQTANSEWDVYFLDDEGFLHGIDDGTDILAGYPMSCVYGEVTPIATSSARPTMQVVFCHKDAKISKTRFDFTTVDFNYNHLVLGLLPVKLVKVSSDSNQYKLIEAKGANDVTSIYGPLIADAGAAVITGVTTAVTYSDETETLTIVAEDGVTPKLKPAKMLYEKDIKGIEQV